MKNNCYIMDTSSLVKLNRENPIDVFPTVWKKLNDLVNNDRLIAPKEVSNEIQQNDDQLCKWVNKNKKMFKDITKRQIEIVKEILKKYPAIIKTDRKYDADPWVIALAIETSTDPQKTLFNIKRVVVSEEKLIGNKIKIPFICNDYDIESINVIDMFREEGWKI
ncbi:MAG: DUF4411 family protein [Candidatus Aenigmarchaeota archaeon]|nr:DUF4411 family protein [Candidatus Aenigmarchaeota archaeon]